MPSQGAEEGASSTNGFCDPLSVVVAWGVSPSHLQATCVNAMLQHPRSPGGKQEMHGAARPGAVVELVAKQQLESEVG